MPGTERPSRQAVAALLSLQLALVGAALVALEHRQSTPALASVEGDAHPSARAADAEGLMSLAFPSHEEGGEFSRSRAKRPPPQRRMPYAVYAEHGRELIQALPRLDALQRQLPPTAMTRHVAAQKEHIAWLDRHAEVTVDGFDAFRVDRTRRDAFTDLPGYHDRIRPRMFLVHWTAVGYSDVDHFIESLRPYRVQYFLDRDARVYELFEDDDHKPAHALGANDLSQGVEIETGPFDGSASPLFQYTPEQIEQTVYLAVHFLRRNGLPVDETTLLGHYAADLIFSNPYYHPPTGQLLQPRVRKFDPPQELMEVIVAKARTLDTALGNR
jgi:hypothetical protein